MPKKQNAKQVGKDPFRVTDNQIEENTNFKDPHEDENGFNRMNTNFFVQAGEEAEIMILDEDAMPRQYQYHGLRLTSKNGKVYYPKETCQKYGGQHKHCYLCDKAKANPEMKIGQSTGYVYTVLDMRGNYVKRDFNNEPAPKFWITYGTIAKMIVELKNELGDLNRVILKVKKTGKVTTVKPKTKSIGAGQYEVVTAEPSDYYDGEMPDYMTVLGKPKNDEEMKRFLKYANLGEEEEEE